MIHRTLNAVQIDDIVATAPERVRRADWKNRTNRVARSTTLFEKMEIVR